MDATSGGRRAKIVATMGPASQDASVVRALIGEGVDVFRLNLAHGVPADHRAATELVRAAASEAGRIVGILADLPGPKLRTGRLASDEVTLEVGRSFTLGPVQPGDATGVATSIDDLASLVDPGATIYLADGAIVLRVVSTEGENVTTEVVRGGVLRSRKGMHLPDIEDRLESFTSDDHAAIALAVDLGADLVGLSFVRTDVDVKKVRSVLPNDGTAPMILAKIETRSAVTNLSSVLDAADAVMVARGDLGIQMAIEDVPSIQKRIISAANDVGKPVITATQMLESMTRAPLPTRAEVSDVANAVLDGTDALMLSEETAMGIDPPRVVRTMSQIIASTESSATPRRTRAITERDDPVSWAVARAAVEAADELGATAILCPTRTGATARRVAAFRPKAPIVGLAEDPQAFGALSVVWGVTAATMPEDGSSLEDRVMAGAVASGAVEADDLVVIVGGAPDNRLGTTDFIKLVRAET